MTLVQLLNQDSVWENAAHKEVPLETLDVDARAAIIGRFYFRVVNVAVRCQVHTSDPEVAAVWLLDRPLMRRLVELEAA